MRSYVKMFAALPASVLLLAVVAPTAHAAVTSGTIFNQETEINQVGTPPCLSGDLSGIETVTFTTSGRFVQTGSGIHVEGTNAVAGRQVFTNGDIDIVDASSHFRLQRECDVGADGLQHSRPRAAHDLQRQRRRDRKGQLRWRNPHHLSGPEREPAARRRRNHRQLREGSRYLFVSRGPL